MNTDKEKMLEAHDLIGINLDAITEALDLLEKGIDEKEYKKIIKGSYLAAANFNELAKKIAYLEKEGFPVEVLAYYLDEKSEVEEETPDASTGKEV